MVQKYEARLLYAIDLLRGNYNRYDCDKILTSVLFVNWLLKNEKYRMDTNVDFFKQAGISNTFKNEIVYLLEQFEWSYEELDSILSNLLLKKLDQGNKAIETIQRVFQLFWEADELTQSDLKNMLNYLLIEYETNDDRVVTPQPIKELMVKMIEPKEKMRIADYYTGLGSIIISFNEEYKKYNPSYYGEELHIDSFMISKLLMIVNDVKNFDIKNKDIFQFENSHHNCFDYILMDAPFSVSTELRENVVLKYGVPSKMAVDWANYQLALYNLNETGKAIVTSTVGALFRTSDSKIRSAIVREDLIEAVILLPTSIYSNTAISTALIVFNNAKCEERKGKILFIDAAKLFARKNRRQNSITEEGIKKIIEVYKSGKAIEGFSCFANLLEIEKNDYNLNANVYINAKVIEHKLGDRILLKEIAEILPGVQISTNEMESLKINPTHYFLNIKNIQEECIIYDDEQKIRDKKVNWYGRYDIQAGDIIMATKGTTSRLIVVPEEYKESFISNNLTIIRVKKNQYDPYVLAKYFNSDIGKLILENITTGTTIKVINASKLGNIEVPYYEKDILELAGNRIRQNQKEYKRRLQEAIEKYEAEEKSILEMLKL